METTVITEPQIVIAGKGLLPTKRLIKMATERINRFGKVIDFKTKETKSIVWFELKGDKIISLLYDLQQNKIFEDDSITDNRKSTTSGLILVCIILNT